MSPLSLRATCWFQAFSLILFSRFRRSCRSCCWRDLYFTSRISAISGPWLLFVCVGTVSFGSLGLVVASVTNTMQETQVLNQLIWLPLIFLSGATLPIAFLSKAVQRAALFLPATYLVSGLQQSTYASQSIFTMLTQFISLVAWAILSFFVAAQLFRWEPETKIPRKAKLWAAATVIPFVILGFWEQYNGRILSEAKARSCRQHNKASRQPTRRKTRKLGQRL